jgi:hypothetical protein
MTMLEAAAATQQEAAERVSILEPRHGVQDASTS